MEASGVKRGPEELISTDRVEEIGNISIKNRYKNTSNCGDDEHEADELINDAKKAKFETSASRVIHIRNIPKDTSDTEVAALGVPFGKVTNILRLSAKNQCFLELEDENKARTMMNYYQYVAPNIRGHPVFVQYSNYTKLVTDSNRSKKCTDAAIAAAVAAISNSPPPLDQFESETSMHPVESKTSDSIFRRLDVYQALIQLSDPLDAYNAKVNLDGQSIYYGCCTLKVDYSKLVNVNVKYNNDKSRDFTKNTGSNVTSTSGAASIAIPVAAGTTSNLYASRILTSTAAALPTSLASYGSATILSPLAAITASPLQSTSALLATPIQQQLPDADHRDNGGLVGSVIHASNLNDTKVIPRTLFILFGVYGDVYRVKILFNKKDTALIQMAEPHQAQTAIAHLHGIQLYGKKMYVSSSKYSQVQLRKDPDPSGLTQDYSQSALHRFRKLGSRNFQNIYPPSATLHLSNIPLSISEADLRELFEETGATVVAFRFFPNYNNNSSKMALLQLDSVSEAIHGLIERHNYQIGSTYLRVSFSKSNL